MNDLRNKNIVITGASGGIGNSIVKKLNESGATILASGTRQEKLDELKSKFDNIKILKFDISQTDKIEEFIDNASKELGGNLDCLINNAGIYEFNSLENLDKKSILRQFEVNALSPIFITQSLKPLLKKSSKVAFITSRMGSIEDNSSGSSYGYRMSKVALSMAAKSLSIDLLKEDIYVAILHPGLVSTRMTGFTRNGISPEESADGLLKRIDSLNKENSGTFWHANGEVLPW